MKSRLKQRFESGETAFGVLIHFPSPDVVEMFGYLGYDWAFIDAEHGDIGRESCTAMVRACNVTGMTPIVRVPDNTEAAILGYLETGVEGIIVPHVSNAEQARAAVRAAKYSPLGNRSAGSFTRAAKFGLAQTAKEYFDQVNDEFLVFVVVEDIEGINNLDEIMAVEGVDLVTLGTGDLANSMGFTGLRNDPEVQKVAEDAQARIDAAMPHRIERAVAGQLIAEAGREFLVRNGAKDVQQHGVF